MFLKYFIASEEEIENKIQKYEESGNRLILPTTRTIRSISTH